MIQKLLLTFMKHNRDGSTDINFQNFGILFYFISGPITWEI